MSDVTANTGDTCRHPIKYWRIRNRRLVATELKSENVISEIIVLGSARFEVRSIAWNDYWRHLLSAGDGAVIRHIAALRESRSVLIENHFGLAAARRYCFNYFALLSVAIERVVKGQFDRSLLLPIIPFECFPIRLISQGSASVVAATSNVRNPIYLLAKLRCPDAYDDAKFVPLITSGGAANPSVVPPPLFYHYRQFVIESRSGMSIFVYPSVRIEDRAESFQCIGLVAHGLAAKTDPHAARRAKWIADCAIVPFLRARGAAQPGTTTAPIAIGDLGGGSGQLTQRLWNRLVQRHTDITQGRSLIWHLVDLKPHNTGRFARQSRFTRMVKELRCVRSDWKDWLARSITLPQAPRFDVLLLCRLFNNLSAFSVDRVDDWRQIWALSKNHLTQQQWNDRSFLPHLCLGENGAGPSALLASNARVKFGRAASFVQLSLSDYFRGLYLLDQKAVGADDGAVYFTTRRFDDAAILLPDGRSALAALCSISDLVVIEDVDFDSARCSGIWKRTVCRNSLHRTQPTE